MGLAESINRIEKSLSSATVSAEDLASALEDLKKMQNITPVGSEEAKKIEKLIALTKDLQKTRNDTAEQERKNLEDITGKTKNLMGWVEKLAGKHKHLANTLYHTAEAYKSLVKSANLGEAIRHVGALTPATKTFGTILGFVTNAAIKAQDRVQEVNKTIIDLSASTGRFAEGMQAADKATLSITTGFAKYAQQIGIASKQLQQLAGGLSQVGFTMEEMGIDKQTGRIATFSDVLNKHGDQWGALSVAMGVARATGLDQGAVVSQLQTQVKALGGSVEGTVKTFGSLSLAANKSRLSTSTLLPILQNMQGSFKTLGLDSSKAAEMIGKAGEVAAKSGVGAATAVEVMGKAVSGMAQMDFGKMAFMGQQMGMGGGLTAGFQFRKQIGGEGGAGVAQQIGQVVGKLMGGTGDLISEEQAVGNEQLAAIRLGQEQLVQQMMGLSANESRVFVNMSKELETLNTSGQGDSERAKELNKEISKMSMSENAYRNKTLTGQEKMQNLLTLISTLVGRAVSIFVRAFAGGAASTGDFGEDISGILKDIEKGDALGNLTDRIANVGDSFEKTMGPTIEKMGGFMGKHWLLTLGTIFGGSAIFDMRNIVLGGFRGIFSGGLGSVIAETGKNVIGGGLRSFMKLFQASGAASGKVVRDAMGMITPAAGEASRGLRSLSVGVSEAAKIGTKGAMSAASGLMKLVLSINPLTAAFLALGAASVGLAKWYFGGLEKVAKERLKSEEQLTAASNKYLTILNKTNQALEKKSGITSNEAYDLVRKVRSGKELTEQEKKMWNERREIILRQATTEAKGKHQKAVAGGAKAEVIKEEDAMKRFAEESLKVFREQKYGKAGAEEYRKKDLAVAIPALGTPMSTTLAPNQLQEKKLLKELSSIEEDAWRTRGNQASKVIDDKNIRKNEEAKKAETENKEVNVKVELDLKNDLLDAKVEKGIKKAAEKDIVAPGRSGMSGNRYGQSQGY